MSNDESIDRLANALTEYREMLPTDYGRQHEFMLRIARKYRIRTPVMREAVRMLYDELKAEEETTPNV